MLASLRVLFLSLFTSQNTYYKCVILTIRFNHNQYVDVNQISISSFWGPINKRSIKNSACLSQSISKLAYLKLNSLFFPTLPDHSSQLINPYNHF